MMTTSKAPINGSVAPGYEHVREAFEENFIKRGERGAALAVFKEGEAIVDLWGGWSDTAATSPWQRDTLLLVFSLTKGITALTIAKAHALGFLDYDAPVTEVWPEFGVAGKENVSIRQLLNQQAGLSAIELELNAQVMSDPIAMAAVLAKQHPSWPIGDYAGNHAHTLGWLANELIRRTDPQGRSLGAFLRDELTGPLDSEFYIGLPETVDHTRIAEIHGYRPIALALQFGVLPLGLIIGMANEKSLTARTMNNPKVPKLARLGPAMFNTPEYWRNENGGAGGIGNARSIAKIYSAFAAPSGPLGLGQSTLEALQAPAPKPRRGWQDQVLRTEVRYSLGMEKPSPNNRFGTSDAAFGTFAIGGSYAFADPASRTSYCYVTNKPGYCVWGDPREAATRQAVFQANLVRRA